MLRLPRPFVVAGAAVLAMQGTLGLVLNHQLRRAHREGRGLPHAGYVVDTCVEHPWADGPPLKVAMVGDSLVQGVGAPSVEQSLAAQTAYRLAAHTGRHVCMTSLGLSSSRVADVVRDQVGRIEETTDLVIVVVGANDVTRGTPPWEFLQAYERLVVEAHRRTGAPVVLTGVPSLGVVPLLARPLRNVAGALGDTYDRLVAWVAARRPEAHLVDLRRATLRHFRKRPDELFCADRYHPSPAGYALLAEVLAESVTALLADIAAAADASEGAEPLVA